jgi:hypothetical protein
LAVLKLVSHPPLQLLADLSSLASFPMFESGAYDVARPVWLDDDVPRETAVLVTRADLCEVATGRCGLATGFGASTVTLGSWAAGPAVICDNAVLLRLHSSAVDRSAIAEVAANLDDVLMTISHHPEQTFRPDECTVPHIFNQPSRTALRERSLAMTCRRNG